MVPVDTGCRYQVPGTSIVLVDTHRQTDDAFRDDAF